MKTLLTFVSLAIPLAILQIIAKKIPPIKLFEKWSLLRMILLEKTSNISFKKGKWI
jgi:hypothetical protein